MIINRELIISERKKVDIINDLKDNRFMQVNDSYDYLLNMALWNLTKEKIDEFKLKLQEKLNELKVLNSKTSKSLWLNDLQALNNHLNKTKKRKNNNQIRLTNKNKKFKN